MKAAILHEAGSRLTLHSLDLPIPASGEVRIQLKAAALNHRDIWIRQGNYGSISYPCVLGSDGSGIVSDIGEGVDEAFIGKHVLINPSLFWGNQRTGQGKDFQILGIPRQGTLAEYICIPVANVYPIPDGYDFEKAAALPLAGLTAHRALFYRGDLKAGQKLLITGIGGGVSTFLLGFAIRAGAQVFVTSSSDKKIQKALELGAKHGVRYDVSNFDEQLRSSEPEGYDLIVDSAGGPGFIKLLGLLKPGGKIVTYGRTAGNIPEFSPSLLFYKQVSVLGTTMGAPGDFEGMLDFITEHNMRPFIDRIFTLDEVDEAFNYIENKEQFGKVVIRI